MVVEFIGCTGAGKTTLIRGVELRLAGKMPVLTSTEFVTGLIGLQCVTNPTAQNLIQEIAGFVPHMLLLYPYRTFLRHTMSLLLRHAKPNMTLLSNIRSLERKLGVCALVKLASGNQIVLVDEGPLLAAHMFAGELGGVSTDDIVVFARSAPLPDLIVYVKAPVVAIVSRTARRADRSREIASLKPDDLACYAGATIAVFDQLVANLNGRVPILVVDNPEMQEQQLQTNVSTIENFIVSHAPSLSTRAVQYGLKARNSTE